MDRTIITDHDGVHTEVHYHLSQPAGWAMHWQQTHAPAHMLALGLAHATWVLVIALLVWAALYFLPTLLARLRGVQGLAAVAVVNLLLGWTVIGWFAALVMALVMERRQDYELRQHAYRTWLATQPPTGR